MLSVGLFFVGRYTARRETGTFRSPTKSIAVLPFENLSRDPDNADFADGVQDEILTDLSRIADLKVIGRASAMQYKSGVARDLNNNCGWAAYWLLNPTMPLREQYLRRPILSGEPISSRCIK